MITFLVLTGLSYGITYYTHTKFIDYSFFIGLAVTVMIWFFTSKGGYTSRYLDMTIQGTTGVKVDQQKYEFFHQMLFSLPPWPIPSLPLERCYFITEVISKSSKHFYSALVFLKLDIYVKIIVSKYVQEVTMNDISVEK
jgi:hypothetical protein